MDLERIVFSCDEKCRICPYPGANCKKVFAEAKTAEREEDEHRIWMSPELQEELIQRMHTLHK